MLTKLTSRNQITIPKKIVEQLPNVQYFDVKFQEGVVVLKPLVVYDMDLEQIRSKIRRLDITADIVKEAVAWVRKK